jgi:signal transduction histidine kinase
MEEKNTGQTDPSRRKVEFFGRIMANVSHEFNNVITVISELAGLLKDLSLMAQKGREVTPEKIESIADNISKQVARGKHLVSHMNRFSHSTDETHTQVNPCGIVENMQVLTDRLFKNSQSNIIFRAPEETFSLNTDPFELRRILFLCLNLFLGTSSSEVSITLNRSKNGGELELQISGEVESISENFMDHIEELKEQAGASDCKFFVEQSGKQVLFRLVLPSSCN